MKYREPETEFDRLNYLMDMYDTYYKNSLNPCTPRTFMKGTPLEKLAKGGEGYLRVKKWFEEKLGLTKPVECPKGVLPGKITVFPSGAIRDTQEGKTNFLDVISWTAFNRYAKYMTSKMVKYGGGNFKKGIPVESYEKSLLRHIDKYIRNKYENGNDEPDEDHLSAIVFNVFGLIHEEEQVKLKK